ncbi:MAG: ABC transporter permease [Fulvivirga sp.]|uniref:ABC transporter permease n=1 Tax=Fulvivirga sp. TaxID=1931237 RepID=UPI0032EAB5BD
MVKNYLKIAIRSLLKHKLFSLINILSLTVGLTCSILLFLYVQDELSFDKFNTKKDSIYRVVQDTYLPDGSLQWQGIFHAIRLGPVMEEEIPEVKSFARFAKPFGEPGYYLKGDGESLYNYVLFGDFSVFQSFDFPIIRGSVKDADPKSVVLTEDAAKKYYGSTEAVGKTMSIRINDIFTDFTVVAVAKNLPSNSSIQFDVLISFDYQTEIGEFKQWVDEWGFGAIITYVELNEGATPETLDGSLASILNKHYPYYKEVAEERGYKSVKDYRVLKLEPLTAIHFNIKVTEGLVASSDPTYSFILIGLVVGILGIACFNFMNLSLGRSAYRIKEVGLRKTVGAVKSQLVSQFLGESILLSFFSLLVAFLLADLLLPLFNQLTNKPLSIDALYSIDSTLLLVGITLFLGLISGFYPAFVISKFNIKDTLSGIRLQRNTFLSKVLIALQFSIACLLVIGMLAMNKQTHYLLNKDLGFDSKQVISLKNAKIGENTIYSHFKNTLLAHSGIYSLTSANQTFANPSGLGGRGFTYKGERKRVGIISVTDDYMKTMGISLADGRGFSKTAKENAVIINQACAKDFELNTNDTFGELTSSVNTDPIIAGVMNDFNYSSLKTEVFPMLINKTDNDNLGHIFIKLTGTNTKETIAFIEEKWNEVANELPFEYAFLNDTMKAQYDSEQRWGNIITYSMTITVLLSCMGLFGMVALGLESKKREISIRKVFGARVSNIVWLISNSYLKILLVAYLIAVPFAYYFISDWLSTFTYQVDLGYSIFIIGTGLVFLIAFITVSLKTINAARSNPVKHLRSE